MRRAEILLALGWIAFAVAIVVQARSVGTGWVGGQPQPGFFPFWGGVALTMCGVVVLGRVLRAERRPREEPFSPDRTALASVLKVTATGIGMLVLVYFVGFYTATLVYVLVYTRFVGRHSWLEAIVLSLVVSVGSYLLFEKQLSILLPRGLYSIVPFFE